MEQKHNFLLETRLNFINRVVNQIPVKVVIFQENKLPDVNSGNEVSAWKVIDHCGYTNLHPFLFSQDIEVMIIDSYGNYVVQKQVQPGQFYRVKSEPGGTGYRDYQLVKEGGAVLEDIIEVENGLETGTIDILVCRNQQWVFRQRNVCPGDIIPFSVQPSIYIGRTSGLCVREGEALPNVIRARFDISISLTGILEADIVMRGGGYGPAAQTVTFSRENITWR